MGYYADLINEKKEKQNKVVKRGTFKSGNWWISQVTAWPNRIVYIAHAEYTSGPYKGEHLGTDSLDSLEKAESYVKRLNSKEEKDNSAESHLKGLIGKKFKRDTDLERAVSSSIYTEISDWSHPRMVVFDKYTDEKFYVTTEDNNQYGKDQEFWISKVQKANEKEEKDNATEADIRAMYSQIQELKKKGIKGENIDKFYAAVNYRAAAEEHRKKYKQTGQEAYRIAAEKADRQADQWIKEINRSIRNSKEKGYYAKLAEEMAAKKNALEPVQRAEQLAREGKQYKDIIETIKKEYNLPTDKATRAADQGKRNYELNPVNGEHKKPAKI